MLLINDKKKHIEPLNKHVIFLFTFNYYLEAISVFPLSLGKVPQNKLPGTRGCIMLDISILYFEKSMIETLFLCLAMGVINDNSY